MLHLIMYLLGWLVSTRSDRLITFQCVIDTWLLEIVVSGGFIIIVGRILTFTECCVLSIFNSWHRFYLNITMTPRLFLLTAQRHFLLNQWEKVYKCTTSTTECLKSHCIYIAPKGLGIGVSFFPAEKYCSVIFWTFH